ncbi:MAG: succinate dehydrogenase assembly factor 2 [Comamonadaceae bacterium CG12_big_fil_rev_8_21_14_0_65_59_15]|nr:MAG: succinate dehydrogenase assembly factor 2 [Comamonadaceae bacterium CG12_big_fil_rev_8_21_14_0_65_59_15]
MSTTIPGQEEALIDERALSKLRWRSRRGLLENDLFIDRFFKKYASTLTVKQAQGLSTLMELADSDLLDLHLGRKSLAQVNPDLVRDDVSEVLSMLRVTTKGQNEAS